MKKETLYKFFVGLVSDTEKKAIKLWLEEDPANLQILLKERAFYDASILADEKSFVVKRRLVSNFRNLMMSTMKWAAVILIAFISSYTFLNTKYSAFSKATNTITVPLGQYVNLCLSDGTKVWLNAGSTFTYPSFFAGNLRKVRLNGEAFFEVAHNKAKPFIVHTHACDVEVLGTKFNIDAYDKDNTFSAALIEGKVKVKNNIHPENIVYLSPDHKAVLCNEKLSVKNISDYNVYRWKEGLLCFEDLSFVDLVKRLEKCYGIKFIIKNPSLSKHFFSGKFRISDGVESLLRLLQQDFNYQYVRSESGDIIYIK